MTDIEGTSGNLRLAEGYHEVVYTLVYPGVLASMLYDFYQVVSGAESFQYIDVMVLVTAVYLLDYFHLFVDLRKLTEFRFYYCSLDLLIAILFGLAFAYSKIGNHSGCVMAIFAILVLMLAYSLFERVELRYSWRQYFESRWAYILLAVSATGLIAFHSWLLVRLFLFGTCVLYVAHIFVVWRAGKRGDLRSA